MSSEQSHCLHVPAMTLVSNNSRCCYFAYSPRFPSPQIPRPLLSEVNMGEYEDASSCEIEALAENLVETWSRYGGLRDKAANGAEEGGKETRHGHRCTRGICIQMLCYSVDKGGLLRGRTASKKPDASTAAILVIEAIQCQPCLAHRQSVPLTSQQSQGP